MAETNLKKNKAGYGYKYTDLSAIHDYLEENNMRYIQKIERIDGDDYVFTMPIIDGKPQEWLQGAKVVDATLQGIKNPAQEQGSALTYARRYSLLLAFGLATEDNDGAELTQKAGDKASKVQINTIKTLLKKLDKDETKFLEYMKLKSFDEMTVKQFTEALKILQKGDK